MRDLVDCTLGHYRVLDRIGAGGMGVVYRAHDERLDRDVAIKVLPEEVAAAPRRLERFEREARAVARLEHPNILTIHDFGTDDEITYAVMELLKGKTLRRRIADGDLGWQESIAIGAAVAEGLVAAHGRGVIHRDLKPENIFLTSDGRVKILDFGIARLELPVDPEAETVHGTRPGTVVGTVGYMSPEQALGLTVDARSDLFSLGTVLFELLTGRRPFERDTPSGTLAALLREEPPSMVGVAPEISRIVERCLRKDASDRFQSAAELKSALEAPTDSDTEDERSSIAVLPFVNMSGAEDDDYLCEGLAEEIISSLTRISGLHVIARTSSFTVARLGLDVQEIGKRLSVSNILEGSVRRSGQKVRVTAQLVDAGDGGHLWSGRYDRELTDVLVLEDEIAQTIAERLRGELQHDPGARSRAVVDVEAYGCYLEGRHHFARGTPEALARAQACFERAIESDPNFALGFDSLAELHWYLGFFGGAPPRDAFSRSTWNALRALELDDSLAETHALLGMLRKELDYNWPEVDRELALAADLNRQSPLVRLRHAISGLLPHGRADEATAELEQVLRSDPLSLLTRWWLAVMLYLARRPERMVEEGRHMISLDATYFLGHWSLAMGYSESGRSALAVDALEQAHQLSGGMPFTLGFLAYVCGRDGRHERARSLLQSAGQLAKARYLPPSTIALGHVGLGDWDVAFEWWEQAIEVRDPLVIPIMTYPFFDSVRGDPRYRDLLRRMNL